MGIAPFFTDRGPGAATRRLLAIAFFAAVMAFAGVFSLPPLDRDEARYAQATAQMLETGDFVVIRFQEDERNKKPAGAYWLQAASVAAFSNADARAIWAYRLPSVLGVLLAAMFTYAAIARLFDPATAFVAAILLASAPVVAGEATIAKTDALLLAAVTGAMAALAALLMAAKDNRRASLAMAAAFWIAIGAGILVKGPIIVLIVAPAILLIAMRFPKTQPHRALRPLLGLIILTLMIGPWAAAIGLATEGRFFDEAFGADMLAKVGAAQESHAGPPGYHLLLAPVLAWPIAALAPAGILAAVRRQRDFSVWFLAAWLLPGWIIFELTATKLPHYVLPLYPALAGLAALIAMDPARAPDALVRAGAALYAVVGFALAGTLAVLPLYFGAPQLVAFAAGAALGVAALTAFAAHAFWQARPLRGIAAAAPAAVLLAWSLLAGILPRLPALAVSPRLSAALDAAGLHPLRDGAAPVALAGYYEPSAIFLLGTATRLADGAGAADAMLDNGASAIVEAREDEAFQLRLAERGGNAEAIAAIGGLNYSKGDDVTLTIYRQTTGLEPTAQATP